MGYIVIVLAIAAVLTGALLSLACSGGDWGEAAVASYLQTLSGDEYTIFNDVMLPTKDGTTTQIDHIVISRFGIFVIETKNYGGWIFGDEKQRQWTQSFRTGKWGCEKYRFQNPIRQNWRHVYALSDVLGLPLRYFQNVVVFCGDSEFKTSMPGNVLNRCELVRYICRFTVPLLSKEKVGKVASTIAGINASLSEERRASHVANLRVRHDPVRLAAAVRSGTLRCPKCGSPMVLRHRRSDGGAFYGCSKYPDCRGTMSAG